MNTAVQSVVGDGAWSMERAGGGGPSIHRLLIHGFLLDRPRREREKESLRGARTHSRCRPVTDRKGKRPRQRGEGASTHPKQKEGPGREGGAGSRDTERESKRGPRGATTPSSVLAPIGYLLPGLAWGTRYKEVETEREREGPVGESGEGGSCLSGWARHL